MKRRARRSIGQMEAKGESEKKGWEKKEDLERVREEGIATKEVKCEVKMEKMGEQMK